MERLTLACGGFAVNAVEDLTEDCLGYADEVYEHVLVRYYTYLSNPSYPILSLSL